MPIGLFRGGETITGNTYGVYLKGALIGTMLHAPWADVHDNNTIASNTNGVWIDGPTVNPNSGKFRLWWNDARDNSNQGVHIEGDPQTQWGANAFFHAECNYWNAANGPDDDSPGLPDQWDNNPGQDVSDFFFYRDPIDNNPYWLDQASSVETECLP